MRRTAYFRLRRLYSGALAAAPFRQNIKKACEGGMVAPLESTSFTTHGLSSAMAPDLFSVAFLVVLLCASFIDIRERIIPNRIVVTGIALWCVSFLVQVVGAIQGPFFVQGPSCAVGPAFGGVAFSFTANVLSGSLSELAGASFSSFVESILSTAASNVIGAFGVSLFALACSLAISFFRGGESLGAGDVKLLFPIGLFAGFEGGIVALGVACVASILYCLARFAAGRPARDFPFAPFLTIGFLAVSGIVPLFLGGAPL